jgi:hypothetical protein
MKLVIERKRWLRGADNSALLRDDGLMCCLGFYGEACGIGSDDMLDTADPEECGTAVLSMWPAWLLGFKNDSDDPDDGFLRNTGDCGRLIEANDDNRLTDAVREQRIAAIFAKHGVEVEFV